MSRSVTRRQVDQAGFRIANLGDPVAAGDATRTDNLSLPLAGRRDGRAGASVLAAPADHVHPLEPDLVTFSDTANQIVTPRTEIWFALIDFDQLVGDRFQVSLSGLLQSCLLLLWLDGQIGNPTAGTLVMNIDSASADLAPVAATSSDPFARPAGAHLLTLTAEALAPAASGRTLGRVITLRGLFL